MMQTPGQGSGQEDEVGKGPGKWGLYCTTQPGEDTAQCQRARTWSPMDWGGSSALAQWHLPSECGMQGDG